MVLLSKLDSVDWANLHHAYGPSVDVPDLLRALVDPDGASTEIERDARARDESVWEHVTWVLWGNVFHQGSVWQASSKVVPFLEEILRDGPSHPGLRAFVISYLHHLAAGYPQDTFPEHVDIDDLERNTLGQDDPGGQPDVNDSLSAAIWARDCYRAVEAVVPTVAGYLEDPDEETALEAMAFCASFPRRSSHVTERLQEIAGTEGTRAGHAVVSLAVLDPIAAQPHAERLTLATGPVAARMGACALALAQADPLSALCIDLLTQPTGPLASASCVHTESLDVLIGRCLEHLPEVWRKSAIDALMRQHEGANPMLMLSLTDSLLTLAFRKERPPSAPAALSDTQRRALATICDHGAFQLEQGTFVNYTNLLHDWGLPDNREGLRAWLAGTHVSQTAQPPPKRRGGARSSRVVAPDAVDRLVSGPSHFMGPLLAYILILPLLVIGLLLRSGHKTEAAWVSLGLVALGAIIVAHIRRLNVRRANKEAARAERRAVAARRAREKRS